MNSDETERIFVRRIRELERSVKEIRTIMDDRQFSWTANSSPDGLRYQVATLSEGLRDLEERIDKIEKARSIMLIIVAQVTFTLIVLSLFFLFWFTLN